MARKKKHEEHENHERWLVSYADFITLLFAFFVVMYAISSVNEGKHRVLSDSLVAAFRAAPKSIEPIQVGVPSKSPTPESQNILKKPTVLLPPRPPFPDTKVDIEETPPQDKPIKLFGEPPVEAAAVRDKKFTAPQGEENINAARQKSMPEIAAEIAQALSELVQQRLVTLNSDIRWLEIEINESVLFSSGRARPEPQSLPIMKRIADVLSPFSNVIHVEGFTDNIPIKTLAFPSNWELSAARAASVAHLLANEGIEESRLVALGYGEQRPVADNTTVEGRRKNRRIVLLVLADDSMRQQLETAHSGISRDRSTPAAKLPTTAAPAAVVDATSMAPTELPLPASVPAGVEPPTQPLAASVPAGVVEPPTQPLVITPPAVVTGMESSAAVAPVTVAPAPAATVQVQVPAATTTRAGAVAPARPAIVAPISPPIRLFTPLTLPPVGGTPFGLNTAPPKEVQQ
ncbi:MAG: flagellar motor protein MotD [Gammaproteobacteria bacterium]|nr:flagellar motor protein MotD [Gammaproteobacteria bacterium]